MNYNHGSYILRLNLREHIRQEKIWQNGIKLLFLRLKQTM